MGAVEVVAPQVERGQEVLTPEALAFVADLHTHFAGRRDELLTARHRRREEVARTRRLDFLDDTASIRAGDWRVPPPPRDLADRRVEIAAAFVPAA